ncbi:hypothetical protein [Acetobacter papayae]|uniref:hypothetical protein n=1 Tax=Acetobacter papayae TaxID=1076592 RepID=UPI001F4875A0|nr:hypothetical protein [Acetobacter papayae]
MSPITTMTGNAMVPSRLLVFPSSLLSTHTLPEHPEQAAAQGRAAPVPVMIGTTSAEYLTHSRMHPHLTYHDLVPLLDHVCVLWVQAEKPWSNATAMHCPSTAP